jgi:hypothetical protein
VKQRHPDRGKYTTLSLTRSTPLLCTADAENAVPNYNVTTTFSSTNQNMTLLCTTLPPWKIYPKQPSGTEKGHAWLRQMQRAVKKR